MNNNYGWAINANDSDNYINFCSKVIEDDEIFSKFKSTEKYNVILEHVDQNLGRQYYEHILDAGKDIFEKYFDRFLENDLIGSPNQFLYDDKKISPTTLRYIKNCLDLSSLCAGESIEKVVEVGAGYGGLCKTLSVLCDFYQYTCIDLPPVVKLQQKYLSNFPALSKRVKFVSCEKIPAIKNVDLFISNYALSELTFDTQLQYYNKVIKNSKIVYITYNSIINSNNSENFISMLKEDGFVLENNYNDYGYHDNLIIAAKK